MNESLRNIKDISFASLNKENLLKRTRGDSYIWSIVVLLAITSLLVVYSATGSLAYKYYKGNTEVYLFKQFSFIIIGMLIIYFMHRVNYTLYSRVSVILYLISVPLLLYTLYFGVEVNDASRWIKLPVINMTIQTSDFAKLALFMYVSRLLSKKQNNIKDFKKGFLPVIIPVLITCLLIFPANLSNAVLVGATSLLLMFIGRIKVKYILGVIGIAAVPVIIIISIALATDKKEATPKVSESLSNVGRFDTWVSRVQQFLHPSETEVPYQVQQANIAIANGGFFGLGLATAGSEIFCHRHITIQFMPSL